MKKKNGFTVLEIVVVILLIGVLMLVLAPRLTKIFSESKKNIFAKQTESLYTIARDTYAEDAANGKVVISGRVVYCDAKTENTYNLDSCNRLNTKGDDLEYYIVFYNGKIMSYTVADKNYCYSKTGGFDYYTYNYVSVDMEADSASITGGKMDCSDDFGRGCDCTGGILLADGYYFWNSYQDLGPGRFPSEYSATFEGLEITTSPAVYIKTLLNSGNVAKHEACLYANGKHFCLDPDYYEGNIDSTKNKLQNDMRSTLSDNSITCGIDNSEEHENTAFCSAPDDSYSCYVTDYYDYNMIYIGCLTKYDQGTSEAIYYSGVYDDGTASMDVDVIK